MMKKIITQHDNLARLLQLEPDAPDMGCNLRGICGKCRVKLLSGLWLVDGKPVKAPADVLSCRTRLLGDSGEVEYSPHPAIRSILADWDLTSPMPVSADAVIGIDLGTTTLAAVKLHNGRLVARATAMNPQAVFGADVISRIAAAGEHLEQLSAMLRTAVDGLLDKLDMHGVKRIAVAGNTVMTSLFHKIDPTPIGAFPFTPPQRFFPTVDYRGVPLLTVPCISGFLGGDLTAGAAETAFAPGEMLVDLGTNCEILFAAPQGIIGTSAAAGPAFEQYGMQAVPGAAEHLYSLANGDISGLCGSSLVDFLALARHDNLLDERGLYTRKAPAFAPSAAEVAELLNAKAAVFAGIRSLEISAGVQAKRIYLAGGFARHLDLDNAVSIGMLPDREFRCIGNTALAGACRLAAGPERLALLEKTALEPQEIPLNSLKVFEQLFIQGLRL